MQLVDLAVQAVDGTKVAANATRDRTYDAERGRRLLDRLEQAIEDLEAQNEEGEDALAVHLPEELADKRALREQVRQAMDDLASQEGLRHINLTDKDARLMKTRHGIVPGYNAQSMVSPIEVDDEASGMLITAVDVVDDPTDYGQFTPMLEQAEETTGTKACMTLADAGYYSGSNLSECAGRGQGAGGGDARNITAAVWANRPRWRVISPADPPKNSRSQEARMAGNWQMARNSRWASLPSMASMSGFLSATVRRTPACRRWGGPRGRTPGPGRVSVPRRGCTARPGCRTAWAWD